jgi:hypothetical protein
MTATVHAFFDESGTHAGSPVPCVAGYLVLEGRIDEFNAKWNSVLREANLSHLHMVDCAHGNGEFAYLSRTERVSVQTKLIAIIHELTARGIGAMVVARVYEELMPYHPNMGSAYNYCIWHCLEAVRLWISEEGRPLHVHYHFEGGHASDGEADRLLKICFAKVAARVPFGYSSHKFVEKRTTPGVQAADLLAWQMYTDWRHGMEKRPRRKDFAALIANRRHRVCVIDAKRILYYVNLGREQGALGENIYPGNELS